MIDYNLTIGIIWDSFYFFEKFFSIPLLLVFRWTIIAHLAPKLSPEAMASATALCSLYVFCLNTSSVKLIVNETEEFIIGIKFSITLFPLHWAILLWNNISASL